MIISKNQYLRGFGITVIVLALVRCAFPSIAGSLNEKEAESANQQLSNDTCNVAGEAKSKAELVYMAASPYYHVDPLKQSIPYLVPRAAVLLSDIGRHFFDSLYVKHLPLHQLIVTSVLRSQQDLEQLKQRNRNTSDNSCHLFGTTIDISYNRYHPVSDPSGKPCRKVGGDTLKWVLAEVLRDLRAEERCYVKYEVKQGCFHITVR